jgi:hypothetical protein
MSAIDFPDNPTTNQIFTSGNRSWRWTGSIWNRYSTGGAPEGPTGPTGPTGATGDTGPTGPQGDSDSGTLTNKGDLLTRTEGALERLAVGSDNFVLVADSGETTGVKWAAVDDTTKIAKSIVDAKGDLIVGTADDTAGRLAVGTNGFVLTADSAEASGLKWAASTGGGLEQVFLLMGA